MASQDIFSCARESLESSKSPVADLNFATTVTARPYWKIKRLMDVVVALAMIITFAPLTILVAALVLIDVGFPIVFWQQRIGYLGRPFRVYKFRTMRSSFDRKGQPIPESRAFVSLGSAVATESSRRNPAIIQYPYGEYVAYRATAIAACGSTERHPLSSSGQTGVNGVGADQRWYFIVSR